jgi:hypothetical protein
VTPEDAALLRALERENNRACPYFHAYVESPLRTDSAKPSILDFIPTVGQHRKPHKPKVFIAGFPTAQRFTQSKEADAASGEAQLLVDLIRESQLTSPIFQHKSEAVRRRNPEWESQLRKQVEERDRGRCWKCGIETYELRDAVSYVHFKIQQHSPGWPFSFKQFVNALGRGARRWPRTLWDMDHRIPKSEGGSDELENLQTLCLDCHDRKTYARKE